MEKYYIFHSFLYLGILTIEGGENNGTLGFRKRGLDSKRKGWRGGEGQSAVGFPRILRFYVVENLFLDGNKRGGERCPAGLISLSSFRGVAASRGRVGEPIGLVPTRDKANFTDPLQASRF